MSLNAVQKSSVISKLRSFFEELRQLPSPGYFGSLNNQPFLDGIFWTREEKPSKNGPFETESALNEAMTPKYTYDGRSSYRADYYRRSLPHVFRDHLATFSHADCQRKNIMTREILPSKTDRTVADLLEITIFDLEKAG